MLTMKAVIRSSKQKSIYADSNQCVRESWAAEENPLFQHSKQGTLLIVPLCEVVLLQKLVKE